MNVRSRIGERFEVGDYISQGGMGTVYRGRDSQTGQTVAIKHLKPEVVADNAALISRFEREGEILRTLNHPNIVEILATVQDAGQYYLVMEFVAGGSLADLLHTQPQLPIRQALNIALDLSDALTRTHRLNILHRDLKPANVLIAADGTPRLTDFGVARLGKSELTGADQVVGTITYLSPEALNGEVLDERSDIWAFGIMLFEMLGGRRPFDGETIGHQMKAILTDPLPDMEAIRPEIPVALVDLVYRMLDKDRQQRISSVRLVGAELEAILNGAPIPSTSTGYTPTLPEAAPLLLTPTPTADRALHNLPVQPTPFVGREEELSGLAKLIAGHDTRLITILGPGGMGKTRLALQAAEQQIGSFADGVYFVALAPLTEPDLIVPAIAEAVRFTFYEGDNPRGQLLDFLREKQLLLVLDNFEHLIIGTGLVAEVLQTAPGVKILVTSRERLNLQSETLVLLEGMDFPDWETPEDAAAYSSVKLFLQSAHRIQPDFSLTADNIQYVARVCRLVQGVPLGIVLAAAWIGMLPLSEIAGEIERSLDFLESDLRDMPERQRSLRAVFEYSWNLMTDAERDVFMKLSIFRGGFTREAAQEVTESSLKTLMSLVNKSLLRRDPSGRYDVHELLRQYAEAQLHAVPAQEEKARDRHSAYYSTFLATQAPILAGTLNRQIERLVEIEMDNVRPALDWAIARKRIGDLKQSLNTLCWLCLYDRYAEGYSLFQKLYDGLQTDNPTGPQGVALGHAAVCFGYFTFLLGFRERGEALRQQGLTLLDSLDARYEKAIASILVYTTDYFPDDIQAEYELMQESFAVLEKQGTLGERIFLCLAIGRLGIWIAETASAQAIAYAQKLIEAAVVANNKSAEAMGRMALTFALVYSGDYAGALGDARKGYQLALEERGEPFFPFLFVVTCVNVALGDYLEAAERLREAAAYSEKSTNRQRHAAQLHDMGWTLWLAHNDFAEANEVLQQALAMRNLLDDKGGVADTLTYLAWITRQNNRPADARRLLEQAMALRQEIGDPLQVTNVQNRLAELALSQGANEGALAHLQESARVMQEIGAYFYFGDFLMVLGLLKQRSGEREQAVEVLSRGLNYPILPLLANPELKARASARLSELETQLAPELFAEAQERGKALESEAFVAEFLNTNSESAA